MLSQGWLLTFCTKLGRAVEKKSSKKVQTKRIDFTLAHKPDDLGKMKERAPRSGHVHLHQSTGDDDDGALHIT